MLLFVVTIALLPLLASAAGHASLTHSGGISLLGGLDRDEYGAESLQTGGLHFDFASQRFKSVPQIGAERSHHTAVSYRNKWYLFGGDEADVTVFDPQTGETTVLATSEPAPAARTGHSAVVHDGVMYVLGGRLSDGSVDDGFWALSLADGQWSQLTAPMSARAGHTVVSDGRAMWVFGGETARGVSEDVWTFQLASRTWDLHLAKGPGARHGAAGVLVEGEFVIFGGRDAAGQYLNDVWSLVLTDKVPSWHTAAIVDRATSPEPRAYASVAVHDGALWVFGGEGDSTSFKDIWTLDLEYLQWELIACYPGLAFPHCRAATVHMNPPPSVPLSKFRFTNPGVSESSYELKLTSAPDHPVRVLPHVDAGHVQVAPAELTFDESNWNVPQTVRVMLLEDLMLPGDAARVDIEHSVETQDAHYQRSHLAKRSVQIPTHCGDGHCMGDESAHTCPHDCRNAEHGNGGGGGGEHFFCGDGLCHEETADTCPEDCSVQGTDNTCPPETPVRCRSGQCAVAAGVCSMRATSTARTCDGDREQCTVAILTCNHGHVLCPDGECVENARQCHMMHPCPKGTRRCFDTTCRAQCGGDDERCPPARRNLHGDDHHCRHDPHVGAEVTLEHAMPVRKVTTTMAAPVYMASHVFLQSHHGDKYYGQVSFPAGSFKRAMEGVDAPGCPGCHRGRTMMKNASMHEPLVSVTIETLDEGVPEGALGAFCMSISNGVMSFLPHSASVWYSHLADASDYCLGYRHAETGQWMCADEHLECFGDDCKCPCSVKHTRGHFAENHGCFALIPDNCPGLDNADQADADQDGVGDACVMRSNDCKNTKAEDASYIESIRASVSKMETGVDCPASPYE